MIIGINTFSLGPGYGGREVFVQSAAEAIRREQPQIGVVALGPAEDALALPGEHAVVDDPGRLGEAIARHRVDVLFSPQEAAVSRCSVPQVILVMDLEGRQSARKWGWLPGGDGRMRQHCHHASAIVTPSEFVKRELSDRFEAAMEKIVVAPPGVDPIYDQPQIPFIEPPYILTVGATRKGRNVDMLRSVMEKLSAELPHTLVVAGRAGDGEPVDWGPRVMRIEHAPKAQLAALYQHCDLTVLPSPYAGCGLTVLEAMRAGATVVCARAGGIPEVAHTVPIYYNPENAGTLIAAMRRALSEKASERKSRHAMGKNLAREYTWETCAWKILQALKRK